ncbi:unnamed protein product [Brugia timori]|uniref:Uncharacterized protein n=1 Tax=Brugia timori TaxID=42155 RepID=A0A3P7YX50_9BILA|nr:unnamed protein product [Brugia timori]
MCKIKVNKEIKIFSCVSVCSTRGMKQCECDVEEDNYCYLCCGNSNSRCMPAHHYNILRYYQLLFLFLKLFFLKITNPYA